MKDWMTSYDADENRIIVEEYEMCAVFSRPYIGISTDATEAVEQVRAKLRRRAKFLRDCAATLEAAASNEAVKVGGGFDG